MEALSGRRSTRITYPAGGLSPAKVFVLVLVWVLPRYLICLQSSYRRRSAILDLLSDCCAVVPPAVVLGIVFYMFSYPWPELA